MSNQLTTAARAVLARALDDIDILDIDERIHRLQGIADLTPETTPEGQLARAQLLCLREARRHQTDFLSALQK